MEICVVYTKSRKAEKKFSGDFAKDNAMEFCKELAEIDIIDEVEAFELNEFGGVVAYFDVDDKFSRVEMDG